MQNHLPIIGGFLLSTAITAQAAFDLATPDGRTVRLNDDQTWEYIEKIEDPEMTYAVLSVAKKKELPTGCRFGFRLQNDLGFKIKSLVPEFSVYKSEDLLYETISRGFYEIKPTNSQYREIHFSRIGCNEIDFIKVHGADHCTMGPHTKFSSEQGECLERIKVEESDLIRIRK